MMDAGVIHIVVLYDGETKGSGQNYWSSWLMRQITNGYSMPVRMIITDGATADCTQASKRIEGITADEYLIAIKAVIATTQAESQGMTSVILPRQHRTYQWKFDHALYPQQHLVENICLHLKCWRGIASCYAKNAQSFLAAVQIRCIAL